MISSVTTAVVRRHRLVLVLTTVALIVAGGVGGGVFAKLSSGGFEDPASASTRGHAALDKTFHTAAPNVILLVTASAGVDDPANRARGLALTDRLVGTAGTRQVSSYWSTGGAVPLRSRDGTSALVLGRQDSADSAAVDRIDALARTTSAAGFDVRVGGGNAVGDAIGTTIQADLAKAEAVAVPVSLVLLVFVFGSLVAASLPLAIGAVAVVGTLLALRLLTAVTDVSVYSVNLTTGLGLGLAVDYRLFVVTRYREELRRGLATEAAIVAAARTAGRTVLFSGLTVALSLAALLVFPLYFLRSFAYAGIAVVLLAMVGALVVLPALLAALGPRIDAVDVGAWVRRRLGRPPRRAPGEGTGFWHRLAMLVMRRPVVLGTAVVVLLLGLGLPFLGVHFGLPDDRVLAPGASGRQVADVLRSDFASQETAALSVVAPRAGDPASPAVAASTAAYAGELSRLPGVVRVDGVTGSYAGGGHVAIRGLRRGAVLRRRGAARPRRAGGAGAVPGAGHGGQRPAGRHRRRGGGEVAAGRRDHRWRDPRAALPVHRQRRAAGQGDRAQPAQPDRDLRRHGVGLPGGPPARALGRLHRHAHARYDDANPDVLRRLRAVDGLRGLPALSDQGGAV